MTEDAVLASNGPDVHKRLGVSLDPALIDALDHFKSFLLTWGFLPADFSVHDRVDASAPGGAAARRLKRKRRGTVTQAAFRHGCTA